MNETTTMSDWTKQEQEFASAVISIVKHRHAKYEQEYREGKEREPVSLADIKICPENFENYIPIMQGINRFKNWKVTAQWMLRSLWEKDELISAKRRDTYQLSKTGVLYKDLKEILGVTQ